MIFYAVTPTKGLASGYTRYFTESQEVYEALMAFTGNHQISADAEGWCDFASVGETYEEELFCIEVVEDNEAI